MSKNAREKTEAQQIELIRTLEDNLAKACKQRDAALIENGRQAGEILEFGQKYEKALDEVACSIALIAAKDSQLAECARGAKDLLDRHYELLKAHAELRERASAVVAAGVPDAAWRTLGIPFGNLSAASVDASRLVGLEVEIEGRTYLIGDVNPDGGQFGQINQAFRRDSVVTRARVRVKR